MLGLLYSGYLLHKCKTCFRESVCSEPAMGGLFGQIDETKAIIHVINLTSLSLQSFQKMRFLARIRLIKGTL